MKELNEPGKQFVNESTAAEHQDPDGQFKQTDNPSDGLYVPGSHGNGTERPVILQKEAFRQAWQTDKPTVGANDPMAHVVTLYKPVMLENEPTGE